MAQTDAINLTEIQQEQVQVVGAILMGFLAACTNLRILSPDATENLPETLEPEKWYPISLFIRLQDQVKKLYSNPDPIMTKVGMEMMHSWYHMGPGMTLVKTGLEFLDFQTSSRGFSSVIRGPQNLLGDFRLDHLEPDSGEARVTSSTPFDRHMEKGVLLGGMLAPGDMGYVNVDNGECLDEFLIRFQPGGASLSRFKLPEVADITPWVTSLTPDQAMALAVSHQAIVEELAREKDFWLATNQALDQAFQTLKAQQLELKHLNETLNAKNQELGKLNAFLKNAATMDVLTNVYNRLGLHQKLSVEKERLKRYGYNHREVFSILFFDLDNFKYYNDSFGHEIGDRILVEFACLLKSLVRNVDFVARFGGDEFVVVLPETDRAGAGVLARRILMSMAQDAPFHQTLAQQYLEDRFVPEEHRLSCSIGICQHDAGSEDTIEDIIKRADMAMYRAKSQGKACFVSL